MNSNAEPKLDAPGAGLPRPELYIARLLFALRRWTGSKDSFAATFDRERESIRTLVNSCGPEHAGKRVLIERVRGLEDSSRYWSIWMTLDHLRIVHRGITRTIGALAKGIVPPGAASTAAVKPSADVTAAVVGDYEKSCDELVATVLATKDLKTKARYLHPWFGPLDAAGWHALSAGHLRIHRVQIERILHAIAKETETNGKRAQNADQEEIAQRVSGA